MRKQYVATVAGVGVPAVVWVVMGLATGRSIGDHAVQLRYAGGPLPRPVAGALRILAGITGYSVAAELPAPLGLLALIMLLATIVLFFTTRRGRGLPGVLSGQRLEDARDGADADDAVGAGSASGR